MLRVRLIGAFALESDGVALPMPERRQACSLLGWLALHPGLHPRSEVAGRFWPDVLDSSARKSLRTELVAVRRALGEAGEGALVTTRDLVGLTGEGVSVDAWEFERLVREGRFDAAADLCGGDLLPGSTPTGSMRPANRTAGAWTRYSSVWPRTPKPPVRSRTRFASRAAVSSSIHSARTPTASSSGG